MGVLERGGEEHFVRDHLGAPDAVPDLLCVDGAVADPFEIFVSDVRTLPAREQLVVLECAGHRRDEYAPTAHGVQWGAGAVGEARWRGTPLHALIGCARPHASACEVILHGADGYARSLPMHKAMSPEPLVVWEMNGAPLSELHGAPLRVVVPGWYATDDVKWLTRIEVATTPFEGRFQMEEYRWIEPGDSGDGDRLSALPVHSLITTPRAAHRCAASPGATGARSCGSRCGSTTGRGATRRSRRPSSGSASPAGSSRGTRRPAGT